MSRINKDLTSYLLSLPERAVRSASALAGGLLREIGEVTLPDGIRQSRLYTNLVEMTLRFMIEQVGEVEGVYPDEDKLNEQFLVRKTAGNGLEMIGILAFRASPVWVLAVLADVTGAGRSLLGDITKSLKDKGLLDPDRRFSTVDQMLDGLEQSASKSAETINAPPLDVAGLRKEWSNLKTELRKLPPKNLPSIESVTGSWDAIVREARRQNRSTFEMSSVMALSAVGTLPEKAYWLSRSAKLAVEWTGQMFAGPLLEHYGTTLAEIRDVGFLNYWTRQFRPYLQTAASQFSPGRGSLTERLLGKSKIDPRRSYNQPREESSVNADRLSDQIRFILEIDKLKGVLRRSYLVGVDRRENSAEHSWHLAMMAMTLVEHSNEPVDIDRVIKMTLIHDIVEVDAGDTYCYDTAGWAKKEEKERAAADRLFGLLPSDQGLELRTFWEEFETRQTPDAKFAAALDRLMPLMHNYHTKGRAWIEHGIRRSQVIERNSPMAEGSAKLWEMAEQLIDDAVEKGYLLP